MKDKLLMEIETLTDFEKNLMWLFWGLPLSYQSVLYQQLCASDVKREDRISSYFIDFIVNKPVPKVETLKRVPVSVDISSDVEVIFPNPKMKKYFEETGTFHLLEGSDSSKVHVIPPNIDQFTEVNLHFKNGIICELEIANLSGYCIDYNILRINLQNGKRIFRYDDVDFYKTVISNLHID